MENIDDNIEKLDEEVTKHEEFNEDQMELIKEIICHEVLGMHSMVIFVAWFMIESPNKPEKYIMHHRETSPR